MEQVNLTICYLVKFGPSGRLTAKHRDGNCGSRAGCDGHGLWFEHNSDLFLLKVLQRQVRNIFSAFCKVPFFYLHKEEREAWRRRHAHVQKLLYCCSVIKAVLTLSLHCVLSACVAVMFKPKVIHGTFSLS